MRHFSDVRVIDRLGEASDFSLSHGRAVELAAEHALADIGTFEAEKAAKHQPRAGVCPWSYCSDFEGIFLISFGLIQGQSARHGLPKFAAGIPSHRRSSSLCATER